MAEKVANIPSVVVTVTGFKEVAYLTAKAEGIEELRVAEYPGAVGVHLDEIRQNIQEVLFDQIIEALTEPKGRSEPITDSSMPLQDHEEPVFEGNFWEINEFFTHQEWTDGLPVIPPTRDSIEDFLKYTDRNPHEAIAILPQAKLIATPFNIAANAVMAGCRPEHLPILIAAVDAISDEAYNLNNIGTTWGVIPYILINGPIVNQLKIECGGQLISKGPNPALGRAVGLIIKNIAGYKPGQNYMGTFGYPLGFVFAEKEEDNPWESFHAEHGFDRQTSYVTAGATINWGWPPSPYSRPDKDAAQSALEMLCEEITKKPCLFRIAERGPNAMKNMITLLLAPPVAKSIASAGYSKNDIRQYLYENARVPLRELDWSTRYGCLEVITIQERVESGLYPKDFLVDLDDKVRVLSSPDIVHILVCGDPDRNRLMTLWSGYVEPVTKRIDLPANWKLLLDRSAQ